MQSQAVICGTSCRTVARTSQTFERMEALVLARKVNRHILPLESLTKKKTYPWKKEKLSVTTSPANVTWYERCRSRRQRSSLVTGHKFTSRWFPFPSCCKYPNPISGSTPTTGTVFVDEERRFPHSATYRRQRFATLLTAHRLGSGCVSV
jgi:hypothetical protein